ncbi:hypothetical protein JCM24511_07703 [Saitozyma sp. JCM 24511]|nr:hypothetical protein JCM24511_07703 [Saitozyma sp. JCM 24511]
MSSPRPDPFWLCHECGAQMRPIRVDGVPHCASCNGEFLEILDPDVNPDPFHELPPAPPTRPMGSSALPGSPRPAPGSPPLPDGNAPPGLLQSILNIFGPAAQEGATPSSPSGQRSGTEQRLGEGPSQGPIGGGNGGNGRTFTFNFPGGGQGRVVFGNISGHVGGGMGPFGPVGGDPHDGFGGFFPGFPPPPRGQNGQQDGPHGPEQPLAGADLLRALMSIMAEDGGLGGFGPGPQGRMDTGDYVMTQQGFDQVLEQLMQAAGPQGPLPASDVVIEGLPRFKVDEKALEQSQFKDCPVCKDDFEIGDEVMRIPCAHIFHVDCLQPWLKVNGSCPVCRFSLVPAEGNEPSRRSGTGAQTTQRDNQGGQSTLTNILNRLWGQGGASSNPTSPGEDHATSHPPFAVPAGSSTAPPSHPGDLLHGTPPPQLQTAISPTSPRVSTSPAATGNDVASGEPAEHAPDPPEAAIPSVIPEEYRARHRQREREQHQHE